MNKYYLGVDVGSKTLGLATSRGLIATCYGVYYFPKNYFLQAAQYLSNLIITKNFSDIIIGYPKNMNNTIGYSALMVNYFVNLLKSLLNENIKIYLIDERLTTRLANQIMINANLSRKKRKQKKDSLAAQLILETYLQQK